MATVRYLTKGSSNANTIFVRLRDGRTIDITTSTGIVLKAEHWSKAKNWISPKADFHNKVKIEKDLRKLDGLIHGERNIRIGAGLPVNREWLDELIQKWQGKQIDGVTDYVIDLMTSYKENLPNKIRKGKKGVSAGTIRNYNTTISRLSKYERAYKKRLRIIEIDLTFYKKYLKFASEKLGLSVNSIGNDIKKIKTVCLDARDQGFSINEQVLSRSFSAPSEKTDFTTLNEQELSLIKSFKGSNYLENARDWLLIGCWTGCRVGDLMKLTKKNVAIHTSGKKLIQYTQSKTGKLVNVPVHEDVNEIIERLGSFPRPISSAKFNKYIKEVGQAVGMTYTEYGSRQNPVTHLKETEHFPKWQLIKSHICRRSFATNHYNKLPNKLIMAVTGHTTEKMLLAYIGETEVEHVDDFFDLWDSEKHDQKLMIKEA